MATLPYIFTGRSDEYDHISVEPGLDAVKLRQIFAIASCGEGLHSERGTQLAFDKAETEEDFNDLVEKIHHIVGGTCVKGFKGQVMPLPMSPNLLRIDPHASSVLANN